MATPSPNDTRQILDGLSAVTRQLSRASGGPADGPPMTSTQRLALFETAIGGPMRLSDPRAPDWGAPRPRQVAP